jgi:elongation factor G
MQSGTLPATVACATAPAAVAPSATTNRNIAIIGAYGSGKTTLLESLLFVTGNITRKGQTADGNTVGDSSPEARNRQMSVEVSVASTTYDHVQFTWLDCPGSVEFSQETFNALIGVDAAIVVCEPNQDRVFTLAPLFKFLDDWQIPHLMFINKMDRPSHDYLAVLQALQKVSSRPLVPHQYPIGAGEDLVGFIDLVTEQAFHYQATTPKPVPLPESLREPEQAARTQMLEALANFDDHLLEELLEDINPSSEEIIRDLQLELGADQIVPVFFGMADRDYGVMPLLEALVREAPTAEQTASHRLEALTKSNSGNSASTHTSSNGSSNGKAKAAKPDIAAAEQVIAQVLKTFATPQGGKLSLVRVWQGTLCDGMTLNGSRVGGVYRLQGQQQQNQTQAQAGEIVALGRLENIATGTTLTNQPQADLALPLAESLRPVYALAIAPEKRQDEVKMSSALNKLLEEDPSLIWEQHGDTHEVILWGQGEIHLMVALERLRRKYNLPMSTHLPHVPYRETIRKPVASIHGRYKHQSGGHGQFGDVYLDIKPRERGEGFQFKDTIVGGVVPKQYIPSVELGVKEFLTHGPLGFPVVDVEVTLTNGSYHTVDSSEQAFKQAARVAMQTGLAKCEPTLLEPILEIQVYAPQEFTSRVLQLLTGRRGQILGYESSEGWENWDQTIAYLPQSEMHDFIVELRSLTLGVGFFHWQFAHLQEVPEKLAERVLASH